MFLQPRDSSTDIFVYVEELCEGTFLDGLEDVYEENRKFSIFIQENAGEFSPQFIGLPSNRFVEQSFQWSEFRRRVRDSSTVEMIDYWNFLKDYVKFVEERLQFNCGSDRDVIRQIAKFNSKRGDSEKAIFSRLEEKYDSISVEESNQFIVESLRQARILINAKIRNLNESV